MPRQTTRAARSRHEDDYDEDERNERRGPHDGAEDDDETPRERARRRTREQDDADERRSVSRRRSRDEDDDDRPSRSRTTTRSRSSDEDSDDDGREARRASRSEGAKEARSTTIGRGRESLRRHKETHKGGGNFPDKFTIDKGEEVIVKFVDDDFFVTYYEHQFFKDFENEKRQKTFVCLGENCPLCAVDPEPKYFALINVIDLRNPRKPELKVWYTTPDPGGKIADEMDSLEGRKNPKSINHPDFYYVVSKKKERNNFYSYSIKQVRADELDEQFEIEPLEDSELDDFADKAWDEECVRLNKRSDLLDIADELSE